MFLFPEPGNSIGCQEVLCTLTYVQFTGLPFVKEKSGKIEFSAGQGILAI